MTRIGLGEEGRWVSCGGSDLSWVKHWALGLQHHRCVLQVKTAVGGAGLIPSYGLTSRLCHPVSTQCLCIL